MSPPRTLIRERDQRVYLPQSPASEFVLEDLGDWRVFEADCSGTDVAGDFVRITGDAVAGYYQVIKADPTDLAQMPALGVIVEKTLATRCIVQRAGNVAATGLTPGKPYFVGLDGQLDDAPPVPALGAYAVTQDVGVALSSTVLALAFGAMRIKRG